MKSLNCLMGLIPYQTFKTVNIHHQKALADEQPVLVYIYKTHKRVIFRIKSEYYLELLIPGTMELFGNTEQKVTKEEDDENVPHLEITETIVVYCNAVNNQYLRDSWVLSKFVLDKHLISCYIYHQQIIFT